MGKFDATESVHWAAVYYRVCKARVNIFNLFIFLVQDFAMSGYRKFVLVHCRIEWSEPLQKDEMLSLQGKIFFYLYCYFAQCGNLLFCPNCWWLISVSYESCKNIFSPAIPKLVILKSSDWPIKTIKGNWNETSLSFFSSNYISLFSILYHVCIVQE